MLYQLSYSRVNLTAVNGTRRWGAAFRAEPPVGFEPTTARLRIECSTPELRWRRPRDPGRMELRGVEPLTSAMPLRRSPN